MRHFRTRRRFKVILILLFGMCSIVFVENRIEDLVPQLKSLAEAKVEEALGGTMNFSIGSIDGGLVHPIVLNDIRIRQKDASQFVQSLVIDNIRTNYYVKDIIRALGGSELPALLNKDSRAYVSFSVKNGDIKGFVGISGNLVDAKVDGYLIFSRKHKINFSGHIKDDRFDIEIRPERADMGSIRAVGALAPDNTFIINMKVDHLKVHGFDITCEALSRNKLIKNDDPALPGRIEGEFETEKLILNFKPFYDIKAKYNLMKGSVELSSLTLGEVCKAYGTFSTKDRDGIDLTILTNNMSLSWLMMTFGKKEAASIITGTMNGKFEFKGPLKKVRMSSKFDMRGGTIGPLAFDYMTASLKGELPFLKIEDARVTRKSGYIELAGELDLRRIGKDHMFDHVTLITDDTAITWDEWSATQGKDGKEIAMRKNFGDQFGFGYTKFESDARIDESQRDSDQIHLNYNLQKNDSIKVMVGQDKDFFGFEHKDKF